MTVNPTPTMPATDMPLALRPREAAKKLGISPRLLWAKTQAGEVPHVRIGRRIIYPVQQLREWLAEQATGGKP